MAVAVGGPARRGSGPIGWARANLFNSWWSTAVTLLLLYGIVRGLWGFIQWAFINAVYSVPVGANGVPKTGVCQAIAGTGACWAVIPEKLRFILFAFYPYDQQWRPALCCGLFIALYAISANRFFWRRELALIWVAILGLVGLFMWGGVLGMPFVPQYKWGGLPLTLILATLGLAAAFPLAVLVALGRRANSLPGVKLLCIVYVELIRGAPLIAWLFMATVMFPLFMPAGVDFDKLLAAQLAIILFAAAYLAEVVRAGLQALPRGQTEAADALGLGYWRKTGLIILPQALRLVIPPLVNTFIGFFKDTSLVLIVGIFDLLKAGTTAVADPPWQGFANEVYLFLAVIYFAFCFAMSRYSKGLESELNRARRR